MSRALAAAGWSYVALCGLILASHRDIPRGGEPPHPAAPYGGDAGSWFAQIKPFCNAVEVEVQQQRTPAPHDASGAGYSAACYALAGKIDRARAVIDSLNAESVVEFTAADGATRGLADAELLGLEGVRAVRREQERVVLSVARTQAAIADLFALAARHALTIEDLRTHRPTLEDVFVTLTGKHLRDE